eukprot:12402115-Karenia_brevis.AAC.1
MKKTFSGPSNGVLLAQPPRGDCLTGEVLWDGNKGRQAKWWHAMGFMRRRRIIGVQQFQDYS